MVEPPDYLWAERGNAKEPNTPEEKKNRGEERETQDEGGSKKGEDGWTRSFPFSLGSVSAPPHGKRVNGVGGRARSSGSRLPATFHSGGHVSLGMPTREASVWDAALPGPLLSLFIIHFNPCTALAGNLLKKRWEGERKKGQKKLKKKYLKSK
ncbi:hypothetical protein Q8A67_013675 [Cirrhinus molitorella]|uniref:Uncharacterized protein n=1 Tax=Cirrhinus molitorella TaxID=172907 RepID=A0AA88PQ09_9TELE|nr:hypothetical protein Q8A67_013675 [Cirrhinus molitorella]